MRILNLLFIVFFLFGSIVSTLNAGDSRLQRQPSASVFNPAKPLDYCGALLAVMRDDGVEIQVAQDENSIVIISESTYVTQDAVNQFIQKLESIDRQQRATIGSSSLGRIAMAGTRRILDFGPNALSLIKNRKLMGWVLSDIQTVGDIVSNLRMFVPSDSNTKLNPASFSFKASNRIVVSNARFKRDLVPLLSERSGNSSNQICGPVSDGVCEKVMPVVQRALVDMTNLSGRNDSALSVETQLDFSRVIQDLPEPKDEFSLKVKVRIQKIRAGK